MKILVVEDDPSVAQVLQSLLSNYHYAVDVAGDGETGLQMAEAFDYALIVLDIMLPKLDGISLCKRLRADDLRMPILLLTGQAQAANQKAVSLNAGADDYVAKPFDAEELIARVQALLRRGQLTNHSVLTWGDLSLDPSSCEVTYGTRLLALTPKEYAVMEIFLRHPRQVWSKQALLDQVWQSAESPGEEAVRVHIKELRKKLKEAGAPEDVIKTVYGMGYRLNPAYSIASTPQSEPTPMEPPDEKGVPDPPPPSPGAQLSGESIQPPLPSTQAELNRRIAERTADLVEANQHLQQREHQWQALFDHALDAIVIADDHGRYLDANPAACELFGTKKKDLIGRSIADFSAPDFDFDQGWQTFLQRRQKLGELQVHRPDGTIRDIEFTAIANFIPGRHLAILRDVTERKRMEAERREAETAQHQREEFLRNIYEGANEAIFVVGVTTTQDFRYVSCNHIAEEYGLVSQETAQGKTPEQVFGPDVGANLRHNYERCLQAGTSITYEEYFPFKDTFVWTLTTLSPLHNERGEIDCIVGTAIDISDRKRAELALQQQIRQEQVIADISQDIRRSLSLSDVLSRTVERVRDLLNTDRVIIFRFRPDWQGDVITESVAAQWTPIVSTTIYDPCFEERYIAPYRQGRITAIADLEKADITPCYLELLRQFQVRANLVVPILQADNLWGLLIVHHCSAARQWQPSEIELLQRLATQAGIAIQQSELYEQTRHELVDRKQMQAVLEASEERFRTLSAQAPIGICQTDADGTCLYTNACWQELSGLSGEDCLGSGWLEAIHPDDRGAVTQAWQDYLQADGNWVAEFRLVPSSDDVRWVVARAATMRSANGNIIGHVVTYQDITERKLSEQKIQEQAALLDITTDAIFVRDLDQRILYWNQGAARLYGWGAAEAIGRKAHELLQNDVSQLSDIITVLLERGEWRGEIHKVTKSGQKIVVEGRWTLVRDDADQPQFILSVDTDITAKKQLEAQFYQAQRLESLGRLASGIAHDLNNVFTPILTIAQILRMTQQNLEGPAKERIKLLEESAKRGSGMVRQILTFTRGSHGEQTPVDLTSLLQEVVNIAQQSFPKTIRVTLDLPEIKPTNSLSKTVHADATQLHQVFMNLCINARDAMPDGGRLAVTVETLFVDEATAATAWDAQVGHHVAVTIADTGSGIAPDIRDQIFEPFFTTKPPGQGTGLGLATVLGIVKNHGGFLQVSSDLGQGTQMKIYLPTLAGRKPEHHPDAKQHSGHGERILVVDDEAVVRYSTQALLESQNYSTYLADDGVTALSVYAQHQQEISLVLVDVTMPNMNGIELIRNLKAIDPTVKTIAVSGLPANREPVLAAGAHVFLSKPYLLETLLAAISDVIEA